MKHTLDLNSYFPAPVDYFYPRKEEGGRLNPAARLLLAIIGLFSGGVQWAYSQAPQLAAERQGYLVNVELPLVGDRDALALQQINRIADSPVEGERPIVVLQFKATAVAEGGGEPGNGSMGSRGSQFERSLALARGLNKPEVASRVRLVAYVPESIYGHAVLPVLACEEILLAGLAEIGRASIDEPLDPTIVGAYVEAVARRQTLPQSIVMSMLDPNAEVYRLELSDGTTQVVDRAEADKRRKAGEVRRETTLWSGGGLAQYSGQQLRAYGCILVEDTTEVPQALGLRGTLRTSQQLPRQWRGKKLTIGGQLNASRVNQIIRAITNAVEQEQVNLLVIEVTPTECDFLQAARLSSTITDLDADQVYSLGIVSQSLTGAVAMIAVACDEAVLLTEARVGPMQDLKLNNSERETMQLVVGDLAESANRPLPLLSALNDPSVAVNEYIQQETGKRAIFAEWQVAKQADANQWEIKKRVAGGQAFESEMALRYRLFDSIDDSSSVALHRLGIDQMPAELKTPWLDASIQHILALSWLPRLLLTIGFFALMIELGNPGISAGGLLAAVCFTGFFWIEGLNGNVEALEILLFVVGLIALAIELFVLPGFGLFGIGGLLMLLISVVLASQTFVWPTTSAQLSEVASNLFWVSCMALGGMIGLLFMHKQIENSPMMRWVTLQPAGADDTDELEMREAIVHREHLLGQAGLTTTRLNPSGKAQFGREIVAVVGTGKMIDEGVPVHVVEVRGNLILVEESSNLELS